MRVLFIQHDHVSPLGPVGERFAHHGFTIDTHLVVPESAFSAPNIATDFPSFADGPERAHVIVLHKQNAH